MKLLAAVVLSALMMGACGEKKSTAEQLGVKGENFEDTLQGKKVGLFTLRNKNGMEVQVTNYGGRIVAILVPDRDGKMRDVVLGHDSLADYVHIDGNFGALIGRYGNRIANGRFTLDGKEYQLPQNNYGHCLHGGDVGYHHRVWNGNQMDDQTLALTLTDEDGTAGFPGTLEVKVLYTLTDNNELKVEYTATTDKPTIVNLTNHSYFNLNGDGATDILNTVMTINADAITPIDSTFMTDGTLMKVEGTPMDFRKAKAIGQDINADFAQLKNGHGYDHNYVLTTGGDLQKVALRATSPATGITLELMTTEPGVQFYVGNFLDGKVKGKYGIAYPRRSAFCVEPQHYPNSPNCKDYPSTVLRPGETYSSTTIYRFSVEKKK